MKAVDIALKHPQQVSDLVNITNRYPFTILLRQGRYQVDAKSVLGVCSLQRARPIQLEIYSDDYHALVDDLKHLIC
ncbi:MAG: HPr family phosphocarrier protein [Clostridia bacterium]|nr:HPr family phosphocarrier protein [Clostridia bacterium]